MQAPLSLLCFLWNPHGSQDELSERKVWRGQAGTEQAATFLAESHPPFQAIFPLGKALVRNVQCMSVFKSIGGLNWFL